MNHVARVNIDPVIDPAELITSPSVPWEASLPAPGGSKLGYRAVSSANETVHHVVPVDVESCDRPLGVDAEAASALVRACASARRIDGGDPTVGSAQEP